MYILVKHRTAGQLGAVASRPDHRGPDGFAAKAKLPLAQHAPANRLPQNRPHVPELVPGKIVSDAVRHSAGEGQHHRLLGRGKSPGGFRRGQLVQKLRLFPQSRRHFQSLGQQLGHRFQVLLGNPVPRFQVT